MIGKSRSWYYKAREQKIVRRARNGAVLRVVHAVRKEQPRVGTRKLHKMVNKSLKRQEISIGRDSLFELLRKRKLLIFPKKKYQRTTYSNHQYAVAPNRIKELVISSKNQVFVSDITYITLARGHAYLFLTTDRFSRKIVGYHLSKDLTHHSALLALSMAIEKLPQTERIIHHSDRGSQYCCHEFLNFLSLKKMVPSMTAESHCYQNAHAERVNGILKLDLDMDRVFPDFNTAQEAIHKSIKVYNEERLHWSLGLETPEHIYKTAA